MRVSSQVGFPTSVRVGKTLADGLAVSQVGRNAFASAIHHVDDVIVVSEDAIAEAIATFYMLAGLKVEGAGAVGLAALIQRKTGPVEGKNIGLLLTGRNIDEAVHSGLIRSFRKRRKDQKHGKDSKNHNYDYLHGSC